MRARLTDRQQQIYNFIVSKIQSDGSPPTIREIGERFGIASTNGVRATLTALTKKGYINRKPLLSRGIELTDYVEKAAVSYKTQDIPILGKVAAGEPILAVENVEGTLAVDSSFVPTKEVFALRVRGESMRDAGILNGDYVLARQQPTANRGDIVVAVIGEEATVKRYYPEGARIRLMPENPSYDPIVVNRYSPDFRIAGKVVGLIRRF
jgi:repressor LexA